MEKTNIPKDRKICPYLNRACIKYKCRMFIFDEDECALVITAVASMECAKVD